jgi:hypothetical protein
MPRYLAPAALVLVFFCARPALAQVVTAPQPLADAYPIGVAYDDLKLLDDDYNAGNWEMAVWRAKHLLGAARATTSVGEVGAALNFGRHYIIVTWIGRDPFGKPTIGRLIVHGRMPGARPPHTPAPGLAARGIVSSGPRGSVDPFPADLPGVGVKQDDAVIEVFFGRGRRSRLADVYASTRTENPIDKQLSAFAETVASPLFDTIGVLAGPPMPRPATALRAAPRPLSIAATVSRVGLPFNRATITWKATAKEPIGPAEFDAAIADLAGNLKFSAAAHSACAQAYIDAATAALSATVKSERECAGDDGNGAACKAAIDRSLAKTLADQRCGGAAPDASQRAGLEKVDTTVRTSIDGLLTTTAETQLTFNNRPETHASLGAGAAAIASASLSRPRVKVSSDTGTLTAAPLPRVMTMAFVNWSPAGYDGGQSHVSWAERVRPFVGAALTPDFGVVGGANLLLFRGVGVLVGSGVMFTSGARAEEIGNPPANPDKPFAVSTARVNLFVGLAYNFK